MMRTAAAGSAEQGKEQLAFSMCSQQIRHQDLRLHEAHPEPCADPFDQKQTVGTFPLFVHDLSRRRR
jgi:hypothetical protein